MYEYEKSFRDIARAIMYDRVLSANQLIFLVDCVLEYLYEYNMHPSYEFLRVARERLCLKAAGECLRDYDKSEGGE